MMPRLPYLAGLAIAAALIPPADANAACAGPFRSLSLTLSSLEVLSGTADVEEEKARLGTSLFVYSGVVEETDAGARATSVSFITAAGTVDFVEAP